MSHEPSPVPELSALPAEVTTFIGRRTELESARRTLAEARLLTLTGPRGVGTTRLAVKLAEQLSRLFADPPLLLDLRAAPAADLDPLPARLRSRQGVLVLDGADAHPGAADLARRLLQECPEVVVVAAGTTVLGAPGEHLLAVPPFVVPPRAQASSRAVLDADAVRLFVERVRMVDPAFAATGPQLAVVRDVCAAADGVPAVIELAAAATRFLPLESVRGGLRDHDSLVDLLPRSAATGAAAGEVLASCDPVQRRLLAMASVLPEPLTLECLASVLDGEDVAGTPLRPADVVQAFCGLVDRSVLIPHEQVDGAFRVLRPTRRAARAELAAGDATAATVARVERHLVQLLDALGDCPAGPTEVRLGRHLLNHRPSLQRMFTRAVSDPESAGDSIRLLVRLRKRLSALGMVDEVRTWLDAAVDSRPERDELTVEALRVGAYLSIMESDFRRSADQLEQSLQLAVDGVGTSGLTPEYLQALLRMGALDVDGAQVQLADVVEHTRSSGPSDVLDEQLYFLTLVNVMRGDHERAEQLLRTTVQGMRARGNRRGMAYALSLLSISQLNRGLDERARATAREAMLMMDALGDQVGFPTCLRLIATLTHRRGDAGLAAVLFAAARRLDGSRTMAREAMGGHVEADVRKVLGVRQFSRLSARGGQLDHREVLALALGEEASPRAARPVDLTRRETEIAQLLVEGLSSAQIASRLVLSTRTVEGHIQRMLNKLDFRSRSQIAVWMSERLDETGARVLVG